MYSKMQGIDKELQKLRLLESEILESRQNTDIDSRGFVPEMRNSPQVSETGLSDNHGDFLDPSDQPESFEKLQSYCMIRSSYPPIKPRNDFFTWSLPEDIVHRARYSCAQPKCTSPMNYAEGSSFLRDWDSMSDTSYPDELAVEMKTLRHTKSLVQRGPQNTSELWSRKVVGEFLEKVKIDKAISEKRVTSARQELSARLLQEQQKLAPCVENSSKCLHEPDENCLKNVNGLTGNKRVISTAIAQVCLAGDMQRNTQQQLLRILGYCHNVSKIQQKQYIFRIRGISYYSQINISCARFTK